MKKVTIVISGGIAAYKMCEVVSRLKKLGIEVRIVLTESAKKFVPELVLKTLSSHRVYVDEDLYNPYLDYDKVLHISLAQETDLVILAPATANIIAKYATGIADDLATSVLVATNKPVLVFPSMNTVMYESASVKRNLDTLSNIDNISIVEPDSGLMACKTIGKGRLVEPNVLVAYIEKALSNQPLKGKRVLINAGGTMEKIDYARCITNFSSGKMGVELAKAAFKLGAFVTLVIGNHQVDLPDYLEAVKVVSTNDMLEEMKKRYDITDIVIFCAAVSDYIPETIFEGKIKKNEDDMNILLKPNVDIAKYFASIKRKDVLHIGFGAEAEDLIENAKKKLANKKFDMIVVNPIHLKGSGFNSEENQGYIVSSEHIIKIDQMQKKEMANLILDAIINDKNFERME